MEKKTASSPLDAHTQATQQSIEGTCPFSGSTPAHGLEGELRYIGRSFMAGGFEWEKYAIVDAAGQWKAFVAGRTDGPAIAQCGPPAGLAGGADTPLYLAGVRHR